MKKEQAIKQIRSLIDDDNKLLEFAKERSDQRIIERQELKINHYNTYVDSLLGKQLDQVLIELDVDIDDLDFDRQRDLSL